MPRPPEIVYFVSAAAFRRWLQTNHTGCTELLVGFHKKSSAKPGISYPEALDEALCFGWIDGVRRSVNDECYTIRFTPRKAKSQWSAINIRRVRDLSSAGRMHASGLNAFEGAERQKRKYSYEQRRKSRLSSGDERQFRKKLSAWQFFQSQPPGYRRTATFWVVSAKRDETRQRRLGVLITASAKGRRIDLLSPSSVSKRQKKNS